MTKNEYIKTTLSQAYNALAAVSHALDPEGPARELLDEVIDLLEDAIDEAEGELEA